MAVRCAVARQAEFDELTGFVLGCQARMIRLAELLTGDHGRAEDLAHHDESHGF